MHGEISARHRLRGFEHLHAVRRFASDGRNARRQRHAHEHAADRRKLIVLERDMQLRLQCGEVFRLGEEDDFADAAMRRDAAHPVGFGEDIGEMLQERDERIAPIRADEDVRALDADDDDGEFRRFLRQRGDERISFAQKPAAVRPSRCAVLIEQRLHFADVRTTREDVVRDEQEDEDQRDDGADHEVLRVSIEDGAQRALVLHALVMARGDVRDGFRAEIGDFLVEHGQELHRHILANT